MKLCIDSQIQINDFEEIGNIVCKNHFITWISIESSWDKHIQTYLSYFYNFCFSGDKYALKMRFVDHVFDDLVIDQMTFKVILPEGAR